MAIAFVQGVVKSATASPAAVTGLSPTTGQLLVAFIGFDATNTVTSVTDNKSNTWTHIAGMYLAGDSGGASIDAYYCIPTTVGASFTVDVAFSAATSNINVVIQSFNGFTGTPTLDQLKSQDNPSPTTSVSSGATPTTTQAVEIVVGGGIHTSTTSAWTLGTGYTNLTSSDVTSRSMAMESKLTSSTGAQTATFTVAASRTSMGGVATFYDNTGGGAVSASVVQVHATLTATGGTQSVATIQDATVSQAAATLTATGATQSIATIRDVSLSQAAALLTATGGTQSVSGIRTPTGYMAGLFGGAYFAQSYFADGKGTLDAVLSPLISQVAATLTATGGTQTVVSVRVVSISQVAAVLTVTGGTQSIVVAQDVSITQVAAILTATGGTQVVATIRIVSISQSAATLTATAGTQSIATGQDVNISQIGAALTVTGGTQIGSVTRSILISQLAASLMVGGGLQSVRAFTPPHFVPILATVSSGAASGNISSGVKVDNVAGGVTLDTVSAGIKTDQVSSGQDDININSSETGITL